MDEIGAHVSSAGGVHNAPGRAAERKTNVLQLFTKMASRWKDPEISADDAARFRAARAQHHITFAAAHDSYLINLGTADAQLFEKSVSSFRAELARSIALGLDAVVSHPGNATDGNRDRALAQNADAAAAALTDHSGTTMLLFECTAGSGTALGANFAELAALLARTGSGLSGRVGVCIDTCHLWAAGYDLVDRYDDVMNELIDTVGIDAIRLFHLNDSVGALGSRRDRHAHIGRGALGPGPFRRIVNDPRFANIPKIIETPKDDDVLATDLQNIGVLRGFRANSETSA